VIISREMAVKSEEAQLVARCRAGEEQAWNELVERYSRYVYAIAVQGFRLPQPDAEDVFQDVFLRVYDRLDTLRNDEAFRPWIAQLTRRLCLDKLSAGGRETVGDVEEEVAEDTLGEIEAAWDVHEALAELGDPCHELLDRFFARDESYRTIGDALRLPAGTIASRISRCLAKMRGRLEGRNDLPGASGGR
jgi:RNA polymerase sigma-70 factor (ECF subfamily)